MHPFLQQGVGWLSPATLSTQRRGLRHCVSAPGPLGLSFLICKVGTPSLFASRLPHENLCEAKPPAEVPAVLTA